MVFLRRWVLGWVCACMAGAFACAAQPPAVVAPATGRGDGPAADGGAVRRAEFLTNVPTTAADRAGGEVPTATADAPLGVEIAIEDPSGHALDAFHAALARAAAGEGKARILAFGASHVAGDLYTHRMRTLLQTQFGDGGPGFVLPVTPWRYYANRSFTFEGNARRWNVGRVLVTTTAPNRYGLAGAYVSSKRKGDWGAITTDPSAKTSGRIGDYDLFFLAQPGGGDVDVFVDGEQKARVRTRAAEVGPGYAQVLVPEGPHRFEVRTVGNGPVTLFGVVAERNAPGVVVDTLGVNGARARTQLYWDESIFRAHVARRDPSLVILAYGTNESGDTDEDIQLFERDLRAVVRRTKEAAPAASCLLVGPSDRPVVERGAISDRPRTAQIVDVQRRVAAENGCGFFDLVSFMGGPLSMARWVAHDPPYAQKDFIHLNARGYARLGEVLTRALLAGYGGSR